MYHMHDKSAILHRTVSTLAYLYIATFVNILAGLHQIYPNYFEIVIFRKHLLNMYVTQKLSILKATLRMSDRSYE